MFLLRRVDTMRELGAFSSVSGMVDRTADYPCFHVIALFCRSIGYETREDACQESMCTICILPPRKMGCDIGKRRGEIVV
jgi:hypothetical protein